MTKFTDSREFREGPDSKWPNGRSRKDNPETKKTHRRKGSSFDTLAQVFRDVREFLFASGVVMRNRDGVENIGSGAEASPSESVFEIYHKKRSVLNKFNLMFFGRSGKDSDRNTNYMEFKVDSKDGEDRDSANGQIRLGMSRDGVDTSSGVFVVNAKILNGSTSNTEDGVRTFITGSGENNANDLGGIEMVYYDNNGTPVNGIALDKDGIQTLGLPTSDPVQAGALWNDAGTVKVSAG